MMTIMEQHEAIAKKTAEFLGKARRIQNVPVTEAPLRYKIPWHTLKRKRNVDKMS